MSGSGCGIRQDNNSGLRVNLLTPASYLVHCKLEDSFGSRNVEVNFDVIVTWHLNALEC